MLIIQIEPLARGQHSFQSQSHRTECWLDGYIAVPEELEAEVRSCLGYCDLTVEDGVLTGIVPHPELIPKPEPGLTIGERIAELEEALIQIDEAAISLYESMAAQEEINAAQDEALIEIYEMMEV